MDKKVYPDLWGGPMTGSGRVSRDYRARVVRSDSIWSNSKKFPDILLEYWCTLGGGKPLSGAVHDGFAEVRERQHYEAGQRLAVIRGAFHDHFRGRPKGECELLDLASVVASSPLMKYGAPQVVAARSTDRSE